MHVKYLTTALYKIDMIRFYKYVYLETKLLVKLFTLNGCMY